MRLLHSEKLTPFLSLLLLAVASPLLAVVPVSGPTITSLPPGATPPTIDGTAGAGEWPYGSPQISLTDGVTYPTYVIPTYVYFVNDQTNLYALVDAVGDQTAGTYVDECLMDFGSSLQYTAEICSLQTTYSTPVLTNGFAAMGFGTSPNDPVNAHRIYEFRFPFADIGSGPGQSINFASPSVFFKTLCGPTVPTSMPFDGATGKDNVWPPGVNPGNPATYALINFDNGIYVIPALGTVGLGLLTALLALAGVWVLVRRLG
jgi:hypothetical protein